MSVSFGKGAVAFFNIGWKATLVVVPPKGGFENRSAKDPGFIYIDDEKTPEGVFRKLPVMERTSDTVRDIVTLNDWRNGAIEEVTLEIIHRSKQEVHAEFDEWLALKVLATPPNPKRIVSLSDSIIVH